MKVQNRQSAEEEEPSGTKGKERMLDEEGTDEGYFRQGGVIERWVC